MLRRDRRRGCGAPKTVMVAEGKTASARKPFLDQPSLYSLKKKSLVDC